MTDAEAQVWAEAHAPVGSVLAVTVLRLLAEKESLLAENLGLCREVRDLAVELDAVRRVADDRVQRAGLRRYSGYRCGCPPIPSERIKSFCPVHLEPPVEIGDRQPGE